MSKTVGGANAENDSRGKRVALQESEVDDIEDDDVDIGDGNGNNDGNVLFVVSRASVLDNKTIPEKPPDDLIWDDNAIVDCSNMMLRTLTASPPTALRAEESTAADAKASNSFRQYQWKAPELKRIQEKLSKNVGITMQTQSAQ